MQQYPLLDTCRDPIHRVRSWYSERQRRYRG